MFAIREIHAGDQLGPIRGPMIRDRVIELACEMTGRDRDRVEPFVCALRRGEHVRLDVAAEIAGLCGSVHPVRVDWIGPRTFEQPAPLGRVAELLDVADAPGLNAEQAAELAWREDAARKLEAAGRICEAYQVRDGR